MSCSAEVLVVLSLLRSVPPRTSYFVFIEVKVGVVLPRDYLELAIGGALLGVLLVGLACCS